MTEPFTPADAPVNSIVPRTPPSDSAASIRFAAACPVRNAPNAVTSTAFLTASGSSSATGPHTRAEGL